MYFFLLEWLLTFVNSTNIQSWTGIWYWCYLFIAVTVPKVECPKLKVSGSDYDGCSGIFFITKEKASRSPSRPVYKKQGYDRFIFHNPGRSWFIGAHVDLFPGENGGSFFFKGKSFSKESLIELLNDGAKRNRLPTKVNFTTCTIRLL